MPVCVAELSTPSDVSAVRARVGSGREASYHGASNLSGRFCPELDHQRRSRGCTDSALLELAASEEQDGTPDHGRPVGMDCRYVGPLRRGYGLSMATNASSSFRHVFAALLIAIFYAFAQTGIHLATPIAMHD